MSYYQIREFPASLRGQPLLVVTKPGFAHWDEVTPAAHLLAEAAYFPPRPDTLPLEVLALGCGHAALGVALARLPGVGNVWLADTTLTALNMARRTLQANQVENAHLLSDPLALASLPGHFDAVYIELPKGRQFTRRWLAEAHSVLKIGGSLYLAGANVEGIQPAIKDARALFGNATILGYKKGNRIARLVKEELASLPPAWIGEPGIQPGTWIEFEIERGGVSLHLRSLPGVFSADRLDEGTAFLLDHLSLPSTARVLDAGCGYGVIGLFAWRLGVSSVDMIDNHLLAIACARENIRQNATPGLDSLAFTVRAFLADALDFTPDYGYTHIVSNPPFHAGRKVDNIAALAFIQHARRFLTPGGQLILVANRFLRYDRLMQDLFGNLSRPAESGKYHILASVKEGKEGIDRC